MEAARHLRIAAALSDAAATFSAGIGGAITPELLERLASAIGCAWATYWQVDPHAMVLRPAITWKRSDVDAHSLERDTASRRLTLSEGTAGHVWRSRRPIWTTDLVRDMCLPRSLDAEAAGLQGGVWFAVKTDDAVHGVVELLGPDLPAADPGVLALVERLGLVLGHGVAGRAMRDGTHDSAM